MSGTDLPVPGDGQYADPDKVVHVVHLGVPFCKTGRTLRRLSMSDASLNRTYADTGEKFTYGRHGQEGRLCIHCELALTAYWSGRES